MSRAVVIVNTEGQVTYTEQVPDIVQEPNYEAAIAAL
jgi:thiol peroxidase